MKKYIALILVFVLMLTLVACGGKKNDPQNQTGSGETAGQPEGTVATTEATTDAEDAPASSEATTPAEDEATATTPKDEGQKDDIKIPIDGDSDVPVETPDDGANAENVISFDELLEVA